ncbi:putative retrotransposon gag domain-containing protein [Helianthus annuus]|nr:putative retrotransposon gag domain-containing protein [Helianthus annuus]
MPPRKETTTIDDPLLALLERFDQFLSTNTTNVAESSAQAKAQFESLQATMTQQLEVSNKLLAAFVKDKETTSSLRIGSSSSNPPPPPPPPPPTGRQPPPPPPPPPGHNQPRPPKILLPTFDGSNPLDWIFQANNYFHYYSIPHDQRLSLAVFYFVGDALSWYKHLSNNQLLGTWTEFSRALELRFGPSTYENHEATLFKLVQTSTVKAYKTEFEKISNRVHGLSQEALKNCFISGLQHDIQAELAIHKPTTLHQAYGLAPLIEDKLKHGASFTVDKSHSGVLGSPPTTVLPVQNVLPTSSTTATPLPLKRLTPAEMQTRRAEGLCFNCDERYQPGHRCQPPKFLLMQSEATPP